MFAVPVDHGAPTRFGGSDIVNSISSDGVSRTMPFSKRPSAVGACVRFASANARSGSRMPTNTTSPSSISRAAAITMSSRSV
jgi:hypothetical protein